MPNRFQELGLEPSLLRALQENGFHEAFPIQARTIGPMLENRDVLAQAHSGSGKTAAYALPIIQRANQNSSGIHALVIAPTRELALQVSGEFNRLGRYTPVRATAIYGGQSIRVQIDALKTERFSVVVGTPGRLIDLIDRGMLRLSSIKTVILDEADRMLDMGFIDDVRYILKSIRSVHQTALFSATMPEEIVQLAKGYMNNPLKIFVDSDEVALDTIDQRFVKTDEDGKFATLCNFLNHEAISSGIIFCSTKARARRLGRELQKMDFNAAAIHGDLPQSERENIMRSFRQGKTYLLVATDVVSRGIDVVSVSHVINYDLPEEPLAYFHRIGRTARAGRIGASISFVSHLDIVAFKRITEMTRTKIKEDKRLSATIERLEPQTISLPPRPRLFHHNFPSRRYHKRQGHSQKHYR